jgi:hypothetical protein
MLSTLNGAIPNMKKLIIQYQSVFALDFGKARLAIARPFPATD